jgi:hypothetical protein
MPQISADTTARSADVRSVDLALQGRLREQVASESEANKRM